MTAVIIEDEKRAADRLQHLLEEAKIKDLDILAKLDSIKSSITWLLNNPQPDLIFLDIQLSDGLSFEIFEEVEIQSPIIFTTAYDRYAIRSFELNSIAYLLKPIKQKDLERSIEKYKKLNENNLKQEVDSLKILISELKRPKKKMYRKRFLVEFGDRIDIIETNNIAYFYTESKVVFLCTLNGQTQQINQSLDQIEREIDPRQFFRINRQYLVHSRAIKKAYHYFHYKLKLELLPKAPNESAIVSRLKTNEFKKWISH